MNLRNAILGLAFFCFVSGCARSENPELNVLFTGYLLGYYRAPDVQIGDFQAGCNEGDSSAPAKLLLGELRAERTDKTILVGMGSNLAVELGSRVWTQNTGQKSSGTLHPKTRNPAAPVTTPSLLPPYAANWQGNVQDDIGDNVGCFLSLAHYDAIVPGKEDFYFGPERLRRIAHRLAAVPAGKQQKLTPVHMLAANLVVRTSYWEKPASIPDSLKHLPFKTKLPNDVEAQEISDGGTVLPFLRYVTLKPSKGIAPYICQSSKAHDPDAVDPHCKNPIGLTAGPPGKDSQFYLPSGISLNPTENYGLCIGTPNAGPGCLRFSVAEPFLLSPSCSKTQDCAISNSASYALPYVIKPEESAVIFGVVDPDLPGLIGRTNLSWKNVDDKFQSELSVLNPVVSIKAAIQRLQDDPDYRPNMRKVLLAEMSKAKAQELAIRLPDFDIVIAAATSPDRATPVGKLEMDIDNAKDHRPYLPVVITPWRGYDRGAGRLSDPLRLLKLHEDEAAEKRIVEVERPYKLYSEVPCDPQVLSNPNTCTHKQRIPDLLNYQDLSAQAIQNAYAPKSQAYLGCGTSTNDDCASEDAFRFAVLKILREKTNADAAMLQRRDFFMGPLHTLSPNTSAEDIDRILWKGDRLRIVTATGATLKKVLDESGQFDQADRKTTATADESGRGLLTFGIQSTDDGDYLLRGAPLEESKLYTIATSNHIAAGDTGYPELNDPALMDERLPQPPDKDPHAKPKSELISEVVCKEFYATKDCIRDVEQDYSTSGGDLLFAAIHDVPSVVPATRPEQFKQEVMGWFQIPLIADNSPPEQAVQDRVVSHFSLKELSLNLKWSTNNVSEADRQTLFGGITEPGVDGANSRSWDFTARTDWVRGGKWMDEYVRSQTEYSSQVTENVPPANDSLSRDKNRAQWDAGFFYHPLKFCRSIFCKIDQKSYPKLGFVIEPLTHFDSPIQPIPIDISPNGTAEPLFNLQRTQRYFGRAGLRAETSSSHWEFGYQGGWERGHLQSIDVDGTPICRPDAQQTLQDCLKAVPRPLDHSTLIQNRHTRSRKGLYADTDWTIPLPKKIKYEIINQAEWYPYAASDDNITDTRYRYDLTQKLSFPILPSISFSPGVDFFLYKNDLGTRRLVRWSPTASLTFSFDHFSGAGWWKSIKHGSGE